MTELVAAARLSTADLPRRRPEYQLRRATLRAPRGGWPTGTAGTIIEAFEDEAMIEVVGEGGATLALLMVSYSDLDVALDRDQQQFAV